MQLLGFSTQISPEECFIVQLVVVSSLWPMRSCASSSFCGCLQHFSPVECFIVQLLVFSSIYDLGALRHRARDGVFFTA